MDVKLISITPDIGDKIVEMARVSSSRKDKTKDSERLLKYLIKHKHWSPFEMGNMALEIHTSKAIGIQLLRHRSFSFQEFSQRYADVNQFLEDNDSVFEPVSLRVQCENNRQSSMEDIENEALIKEVINHRAATYMLYRKLINMGVSRETARMELPMATTTKIYMNGSIRSWVHFLQVRDDEHAQLEVQHIAKKVKEILIEQVPVMAAAFN